MADIAELGYRVDSSGLVQGTKALDDNAAAADKAGAAAESLEKSQQGVAKSSAFWAREQAKINARVQEMERIEQRTAAATKQAATATEAHELNLQKLLGQINPTVAALDRLAEQEDRLARARDLGMLKPQVWQQYQSMLDATRAKTLEVSRTSSVLGGSIGALNLQTIEAQQSIVMLLRSLASGDLMGAQSSITSLTTRTGALGGAFTATGVAVGGAVAAIAAIGVAAAKGYMEMRDLDRLLIGMGGSAGALTGSLSNARNEIGRMTGDYQGASVAINQVIQGGKVLSDNAVSIASAATSIASLTGQSIASVTSSIADLADGGTDALVKLNRQYGFLTVASFNQIEAVRAEKGETAALQLALAELERAQNDRVRSMRESAGTLETAWRGVKGEIMDTIQAFKNIGRTDIEQRLQEAIWNLHNVRATTFGDPMQSERYMKARAQVSQLLGERMDMQDREWADERQRRREKELIEVQAAAKAEAASASEAINLQLSGLDRVSAKLIARNKIIEQYNKLSDNDARHFDGSMQRLISNSDAEIDKRFNRAEGRSQPEKDANSLARAYASLNEQMAQQIALYGDTSRVAATRYQIERGNLKGLRADLAGVLIAQAEQLDAQSRQKDATQALTRLQSELNKQEKSGLAVAQERLRVLNEAKGEGVISDGDYNATLAKIVSAGTEAPKVTGVDALYGGSSGELAKLDQQRAALEEWYSGQLLRLDAFRQSEASVNAIYDEQALVDRQAYVDGLSQIDRARQNVMLATAEQGFAAVADLMRTSFSEQSALYRAAFVVQKAAAIAQATLAIQTGIAEAAKNPWPANLAAMASVAAATAGLVSNIAAVGMAHDGIHSVPTEGTWLLNEGERVLTAGTAAKMDATLDRISASRYASGDAASSRPPTIINVAGDPDQRTLQALKSLMAEQEPITINRARTIIGGDLATGSGVVGRGMKHGYASPRRVR